MLRLFHGVLAHDGLISTAVLVALKPKLVAARDRLDAAIAPRVKQSGYAAARDRTASRDATHDRSHRFFCGLLDALCASADLEIAAAAQLALATLYPDKLTVVNAAYADEAAAGPTFAKKLALPEVAQALATLERAVPHVSAYGQDIVRAAAEVGEALAAQDALFAAEAGAAASELFAARTEAHQLFALFAQVVAVAAYPDDSPEHRTAREALLGPYRRYLASGAGTATPPAPAGPPEA